MLKIPAVLTVLLSLLLPTQVYAHEAYVLTPEHFNAGLKVFDLAPFAPLLNASYLPVFFIISVCVAALFMCTIFWSTTKLAGVLDKAIKKLKFFGPLIIRIAISASFIYAAQANSIFGPELSLSMVPGGQIIRFLLFLIGLTVLFGFLTEISALIGIVLFLYIAKYYGFYMVTYSNYFGELIVLLLFGSRFLSLDLLLFKNRKVFNTIEKYKKFEIPIVRVLYGIALIYAGYTIKFLHTDLSVDVYNEYHLKDFFHASAEFIASGAGLSEIMIGAFILLGFAQRLTIIISLIFITLSLLYFHEMLWPHFMLYGISLSLFINSADELTVDRRMIPWVRNMIHGVFPKKSTRKR